MVVLLVVEVVVVDDTDMFIYNDIQDLISKTLIGQILVKIGDTDIRERITNAHYYSDDNTIIVSTETSENYIYNSTFVVVPNLVEIDWETEYWVHPIEPSDDVYTVEEFHDIVSRGGFIDSDGYGTPANATTTVYREYKVKTLAAMKYSKSITHIVWNNR